MVANHLVSIFVEGLHERMHVRRGQAQLVELARLLELLGVENASLTAVDNLEVAGKTADPLGAAALECRAQLIQHGFSFRSTLCHCIN